MLCNVEMSFIFY